MKHITPIPELDAAAIARFWSKAEPQPNGCIYWTGKISSGGYGATTYRKKYITVHRLAYTLAVGPIPAGLVIDHLCRNRACMNPEHLEPVTTAENVHRGDRMGPYRSCLHAGIQPQAQAQHTRSFGFHLAEHQLEHPVVDEPQ